MMKEALLGFDAFEAPPLIPNLVLGMFEGKCSVDDNIWYRLEHEFSEAQLDSEIGLNMLWTRLGDLADWLESTDQRAHLCAITLLVHPDDAPPILGMPLCPLYPLESRLERSWRLLGFDVADCFYTSSLTNCGAFVSRYPELVAYSSGINKFGLFKESAMARDFRRWSDKTIVEHLPFFVFGLYLVESRGVSDLFV